MSTPEFRLPDEFGSGPRRSHRESHQPVPERNVPDKPVAPQRHSRSITPFMGGAVPDVDRVGFPLSGRQLDACVRAALQEDGAFEDVPTIACVLSTRRAHGMIVARHAGIVAGIPFAVAAFRLLDPNITIRVDVDDGEQVSANTEIMRISGLARAILSAERVALNYLQRLSGIATSTSRYVESLRGTRTMVDGTWRVTPGVRLIESYAMRAGGARPDDTVCHIREHHVAAMMGDLAYAVQRVRAHAEPDARIEVQCRSPGQVRAALAAGADAVLLDGMNPAQVRECVEVVAGRAKVNAAGGIALDTVRSYAHAGADHVSIAGIVQEAGPLELTLEMETA